jgi:hypothetical protein
MVLGDRSLRAWSTGFGLRLSASSCCFLSASMNGIRVRMAVSSVYTPSVRVAAVAEKPLTRRGCAGRRAVRRHLEMRGTEVYSFAIPTGCSTAQDRYVVSCWRYYGVRAIMLSGLDGVQKSSALTKNMHILIANYKRNNAQYRENFKRHLGLRWTLFLEL